MVENINIQTLKVSPEKFFKTWLIILQPFLKLTNKELNLLAKLLYHRYLISLEVINKDLIDELLFSSKTKKDIMAELNIPEYAFNNILSYLRKKNLITGKNISSKIIPVIKQPLNNFKLVYNFEIA